MVGAVPTPEYHDGEYHDWLGKHFSDLEKEAKEEYYRQHGLMIWNITESAEAEYQLRSGWRKWFGLDSEFKNSNENTMQYLGRVCKAGNPIQQKDGLYVVCRKISLDFEITDLVKEKMDLEDRELEMTLLSLNYIGWRDRASVPKGQVYRRPDITQFPRTLFRCEDVLQEEFNKHKMRKIK